MGLRSVGAATPTATLPLIQSPPRAAQEFEYFDHRKLHEQFERRTEASAFVRSRASSDLTQGRRQFEFMLSLKRDLIAAKLFLRLCDPAADPGGGGSTPTGIRPTRSAV